VLIKAARYAIRRRGCPASASGGAWHLRGSQEVNQPRLHASLCIVLTLPVRPQDANLEEVTADGMPNAEAAPKNLSSFTRKAVASYYMPAWGRRARGVRGIRVTIIFSGLFRADPIRLNTNG